LTFAKNRKKEKEIELMHCRYNFTIVFNNKIIFSLIR